MAAARQAPDAAASPALQKWWQRKTSVRRRGLFVVLKQRCWMVLGGCSWNISPDCWLVLSQAVIYGDMLDATGKSPGPSRLRAAWPRRSAPALRNCIS